MKSTPAAPGCGEVLVAGDPEWRTEAERLRDGIPVELAVAVPAVTDLKFTSMVASRHRFTVFGSMIE
jgi:LDH2 family malate/lactate/ureidoglycolate dehydrogenase